MSDQSQAQSYYPVCLDLRGKSCLVVGGGEVACHKARGLLEAGAVVRMVAPVYSEAPEGVERTFRPFEPSDLAGMSLVIAATDERHTNAGIAQEARGRGVWVNTVDDPANCDFILPAVVRQGELLITVSTSGASPVLARRLKQELSLRYGQDYGQLTAMLRRLRERFGPTLKATGLNFRERRDVWEQVLDLPMLDLIRLGQGDAAEGQATALLEAAVRDSNTNKPKPVDEDGPGFIGEVQNP